MTAASLLITGGEIVDGTGSPGFRAAVAVVDGRLRILRGEIPGLDAERRIDATNLVVAPGFIDAHSHSDLIVLEDRALEAKTLQGVTTEIVGVDGLSYAPFPRLEDLRAFVQLNSGISGDPETPYDWCDLPGYFARVDGRTSVNVASYVGNTA